jgi:putative flippase GtrA
MIESLLVIKLLKFVLVGFSGMLIDYGATWLLKEKFRINQYVANSVGFILAASSNYVWNRIWTFASQSDQITREYLSFILIAAIGLILNNFVVFLLNGKLRLSFYLAKLLAIIIVTSWNFSMNFLITFSK